MELGTVVVERNGAARVTAVDGIAPERIAALMPADLRMRPERPVVGERWEDRSTRVDPQRDSTFVERTPIDYLDFASPVAGLGSKLGIDATTKWPGETDREWGRPISMRPDVVARVDELWAQLGL